MQSTAVARSKKPSKSLSSDREKRLLSNLLSLSREKQIATRIKIACLRVREGNYSGAVKILYNQRRDAGWKEQGIPKNLAHRASTIEGAARIFSLEKRQSTNRREWKKALELFPTPPKSMMAGILRGRCLQKSGKSKESIFCFYKKLEKRYPDKGIVFLETSKALSFLGKPEEGLNYAQHALQLQRQNPHTYTQLAKLYLQQNNTTECIKSASFAIQLSKQSQEIPIIYLYRGIAYFKEGKFQSAQENLNKYIRIFPNDPTGNIVLGLSLIGKGVIEELDRGLEYLKKAADIERNPKNLKILSTAYEKAAKRQIDEKNFEKCAQYLDEAWRLTEIRHLMIATYNTKKRQTLSRTEQKS